MEKPENKKTHFSVSTFKKTKALTSIIPEEKEKNERKKRSYSFVIPKRFVPKLKPKKALVSPSYLNLSNNKKIERNENAENIEVQSAKDFNEDNISLYSSSESSSYIEEDIIQDKASNLDDDIFDIRKKLSQIKNNSSLIINNIKESNDLSTLNLKKKFSFDENCNNKFFSLKNDINNNTNFDNELSKINKYKSVLLYNDDKGKPKGQMPFLIFDVLTRANQNKNNL